MATEIIGITHCIDKSLRREGMGIELCFELLQIAPKNVAVICTNEFMEMLDWL
jgi:hypothetical protein